jgi:release factor glutamine methyltransferase
MQPTLFSRSRIRSLISEAEVQLAAGPHPERARRDADALFLFALRTEMPGVTQAWLIAHDDEVVAPDVAAAMDGLVQRRFAGEPMQYIAGETEFYRLPFRVDHNVLIPRPETEHLVEKTIALALEFARPRIVDVGTGSGAIAIALARNLRAARITATEISAAAMAVARENAERNGVADRVRWVEGDLLEPVAVERFDIVVANPPYVAQRDRDSLSMEVREYEPAQALFAGEDGLEIYRRLIPAAFAVLVPGGFVALEIGFGQSDAVGALLSKSGFTKIEFSPDLQGIPRVASARRL